MSRFVTQVPAITGLTTKSGAMLFHAKPMVVGITNLQLALSAMHDKAKIRDLLTEKHRCNIKDNIKDLRDALNISKQMGIKFEIICMDSPHGNLYHESCWQNLGWNKKEAKKMRFRMRHISHQLEFKSEAFFVAFRTMWQDSVW